MYHEFKKNPERFLQAWLEGAVGNIYESPVRNIRDKHDGHLLIQPVVSVKYWPNDPSSATGAEK